MDLVVFRGKSIDVHKVLDSFLQIGRPYTSRLRMKLPDADAFTDSFRARCASLPPLLPPQAPSLPHSTYQMSHFEWLAILDDKHPVVDLAHSLCLPRGELKEKVSSMVAERFQMHSDLKTEARKMLNSYLAASALYGEWRWESAIGLRGTKRFDSPG
jgi:hypothetical protein